MVSPKTARPATALPKSAQPDQRRLPAPPAAGPPPARGVSIPPPVPSRSRIYISSTPTKVPGTRVPPALAGACYLLRCPQCAAPQWRDWLDGHAPPIIQCACCLQKHLYEAWPQLAVGSHAIIISLAAARLRPWEEAQRRSSRLPGEEEERQAVEWGQLMGELGRDDALRAWLARPEFSALRHVGEEEQRRGQP